MEKRVLLMILDGFGISDAHEHNAIYLAKKPNLDQLMSEYPHSQIKTSGVDVGLPQGVMGNSEVGHLNMGSGRVVKQELSKIGDFAVENGFESLKDIQRLFSASSGNLHIIGLLSDGSVHSHEEHLFNLLRAASRMGCKRKVFIHVITDGRDTPPRSALKYIKNLEAVIKETGQGKIATVGGRFYIMDRDKRWDRTQTAYDILTGQGEKNIKLFKSAEAALSEAYEKGENDEFVFPKLIEGFEKITGDDSLLFFNFRADRMRQICQAFGKKDFNDFLTPVKIAPDNIVTFTQYDETFPFKVLFPPTKIKNTLGAIVAEHGDKQLRIAETEKYAHVTYFFNGGEEEVYKGEERVLVPSPRDVATYDLKPEMSARSLTDQLLQKMNQENFRLIVLNFANSDMVGHTGVEAAAIKAIEILDECIGRIVAECKKLKYDLLITADHGNSECMVDPKSHSPHTAHTTNPVPLIWMPAESVQLGKTKKLTLKDGILADIAPSVLKILGWKQPSDMTGHPLMND
jgi:2,3-bisphosphoglycerate-independent phosphoglycerate mutase